MKKIIFVFIFSLLINFSLFADVSELASALEKIKPTEIFEPKEPVVKPKLQPEQKSKPKKKPKKKPAILKIDPEIVEKQFTRLGKLSQEIDEELGDLAGLRKVPLVKPKTELETEFKKLTNNPALFEQEEFKKSIKKIYFGDPDDEIKPSIWKKKEQLMLVSPKEREYRRVMAEIAAILNPDLKESVKGFKEAMAK